MVVTGGDLSERDDPCDASAALTAGQMQRRRSGRLLELLVQARVTKGVATVGLDGLDDGM